MTDYRIFVGHYRNDPATAAAIASVDDPRIEAVEVAADGPTTKADCLNHLYDALIAYEMASGATPRRSCCTTPRTSSTASSCASSTA